MTIEVILKDMSTIYPSYDPEHRKAIIEFYSNLFENGEIVGWKVV